jgi:hypothetical protein
MFTTGGGPHAWPRCAGNIKSATDFVHFLQYLTFNPNLAILVGFCGGTEEHGIVVLFQDIEKLY